MPETVEERHAREKAKLLSGLALLGQMERSRRMTDVQLTAARNAAKTAALELEVESLDRWARRVKIARAAAIGLAVGAYLGPVVLPYLKGMAGTYGSTLFTGTMMIGGGIAQTLTSSSGELPGRSAMIEALDIAFMANFEDRLRTLPLESRNLMWLSDNSQYDFIFRLGQQAEQTAIAHGAKTSAQLSAAKAMWLENYWEERQKEIRQWDMAKRSALQNELLQLRVTVDQLERQMQVSGPPVPR